jgi:hypothetical protein
LRRAAEGERRTAIVLYRLGTGWQVCHSVRVGPDLPVISHLVVGPPGVFVILARHHRVWRRQLAPERTTIAVLEDEITVDGVPVPYIPQARAQAWRAARALSGALGTALFVRPVVVLSGADDVRFHNPPARVEVLARRFLARHLTALPRTLPPALVEQIHDRARREQTWRT